MDKQLHKRLSNDFIISILLKYKTHKISLKQPLDILKIKKTRFYELFNKFKNNPKNL